MPDALSLSLSLCLSLSLSRSLSLLSVSSKIWLYMIVLYQSYIHAQHGDERSRLRIRFLLSFCHVVIDEMLLLGIDTRLPGYYDVAVHGV